MTEFICGVQNTGKSTLVYNRIKDDLANGKKVILIVPDQEALSAEAELAEVCRDIAVYNLKVYGFSRLADDVFRTYGGICTNYVDGTGATLALFLAICSVSPALQIYKNVSATDRSLLSELLATLRGFKRQGISPEDLETAAKAALPVNLVKKISDLALIYAAYETAMKNAGDDPDDDTARMYKILSENGGFAGNSVYIDSFISFTGVQMKVISLIMQTADSLTVTVGAPVSDKEDRAGSVLAPVYDTYKKLSAQARRYGDIKITDMTERYAAPELNAMELILRGKSAGYGEKCERIRIFAAKTCYEEADMIAADIRKKLMNGARCRDIAVVGGDLQNRRGVIDAALEKYGVPYFTSVRTDARQKSLFRFIQSALNIYTGNFRAEDVSAYIRTGLIPLPDKELDLFGDYIRRRNISKAERYVNDFTFSPESFGAPQIDGEKSKLARINAVRAYVITPLYDFFTDCKNCTSAAEITEALIRLVVKAGVPDSLRRIISEAAASGDGEEAQETAQLWNVFLKITRRIRTFCRDLPMKPSQYSALLDTVLSQTTIGRIPTSIDEVMIGEGGTLRVRGVKHVYVIGANEGEFPASVSDSGIIDDKEKEYLSSAGIEFETDTEKETERKSYDFYRCACLSSETVTFSYCRLSYDDANGEKRICDMLSRLNDAFQKLPVITELSAEDLCLTKEAAFEYYSEHRDTDTGRALERIFSEDKDYSDKLAALSKPICDTEETLSKETTDILIPEDLTVSPTRLETFTGCSIKHCCRYFLKLGEDDEIEFGNLDSGIFVHLILQKITDDYILDTSIADYTDKELLEYTLEFIAGHCRTKLGIDLSKRGFARLRGVIKRLCVSVLPAEREILNEFKYGKFRPYKTELRISKGGKIAPCEIHAVGGRTVRLSGQIDRVDVYQKDGKTYIKLVDYKSGGSDFQLSDTEKMEGVQLFIYMIDAVSTIGTFPSPIPAALYYMDGESKTKTAESGDVLGKKDPLDRSGVALNDTVVKDALGAAVSTVEKIGKKKKGIVLLQTGEELDDLFDKVKKGIAEAVDKMASGRLIPTEKEAKSAPCQYCGFSAFCRYTEKKNNKW